MRKLLVGIAVVAVVGTGVYRAVNNASRARACEAGSGRVEATLAGLRASASGPDYEKAVIEWNGFRGDAREFRMAAEEFDQWSARLAIKGLRAFEITSCQAEVGEIETVAHLAVTVDGKLLEVEAAPAKRLVWR